MSGTRRGGGDGEEAAQAGRDRSHPRQVEVLVAQGKRVAEGALMIGVTEATYYRWRSEYGGLKLGKVSRLKQLDASRSLAVEALS
ncbi:transposase [Roseomonas marmotae]|uniref:transposase n=1 Tax=Roseomonas marmotae TaxID=2768161 RepID=UPI0038CFD23F